MAGRIATQAALGRVSRYRGVSLREYRLSRFSGPLSRKIRTPYSPKIYQIDFLCIFLFLSYREFPNLVVCNFYKKALFCALSLSLSLSISLFCAFLRSFAGLRLRSFALFCARRGRFDKFDFRGLGPFPVFPGKLTKSDKLWRQLLQRSQRPDQANSKENTRKGCMGFQGKCQKKAVFSTVCLMWPLAPL